MVAFDSDDVDAMYEPLFYNDAVVALKESPSTTAEPTSRRRGDVGSVIDSRQSIR